MANNTYYVPPSMSWRDEPMTQVLAFARRFGPAHAALAMHAAVPLGLTPELLHVIRLNLVRSTPWIGEADLLLSPICQDLGDGFYQMAPDVRDLLLDELRSDPSFGEARIRQVAELLMAFVRQGFRAASDVETRSFLLAQEWTALAYLQPALAARSIAAALRDGLSAGRGSDTLRIARLARALAAPLHAEEDVLLYAAGVEKLATGQTALGVRFLEALGPANQQHQVQGVPLPSADELRRSVGRNCPVETDSFVNDGAIGETEANDAPPEAMEPAASPALVPLRIAAYWPRTVQPGKWHTILVIVAVHATDESADDAAASRKLGPQFDEYRKSTQDCTPGIPRLDALRFSLEAADVEFDPSSVIYVFGGDERFAELQFRANARAASKPLFVGLNISYGGALLAEMAWKMNVGIGAAPRIYVSCPPDMSIVAGLLVPQLKQRFGENAVIRVDEQFGSSLNRHQLARDAVVGCSALLAVMGPNWRAESHPANPERKYEHEVAVALQCGIPVIPVLFGGASMPSGDDLPQELRELPLQNALEVRSGSVLPADVARLMQHIENIVNRSPQPPRTDSSRKVYISYSHKDRGVVETFKQTAKDAGDVFPQDQLPVKQKKHCVQLMDEADVFLLFWSQNATQSEWVRWEIEYALSLNRPDFIRPVYWEDPLPVADMPEELRRLHFQRLSTPGEAANEPAEDLEPSTPPDSASKLPLRVFLSGPHRGLAAHRERVVNAVHRLGHFCVSMETDSESQSTAVEQSFDMLGSCDIYVGVFGWRYGWIPPRQDRSISELQFREAKRLAIPLLIFLMGDDVSIRADLADIDDAGLRVRELRKELLATHAVQFFADPEDLALKVSRALVEFQAGRRAKSETRSTLPELPVPDVSEVRKTTPEPAAAPREASWRSASEKPATPKEKQVSLVVLGAPGAGKSFWQATLYSYITRGTYPAGVQFDAVPSDDAASFDRYLDSLMKRGTPPPTVEAISPQLTFRFQGRSGWFRRGASVRVNLASHSADADISPSGRSGTPAVQELHGLVMLLDPTRSQFEMELHTVGEIHQRMCRQKGERMNASLKIPLALCLSKIDLLNTQSRLGDQATNWLASLRATADQPATLKILQSRSQLCEQILPTLFPGRNLRADLESRFRPVLCFPMTSVNLQPAESNEHDLRKRTMQPFGVLEPLLWLLESNGLRALER